MIKAVFIDRDGTLNIDQEGYIGSPERFELYPFAAEAVRKLNEAGYKIFVVTNQSGIARGYYSENDLDRIHQKMIEQFKNEAAEIDEIYYSPYFKEGSVEPFNIEHEDRKPGLGLFHKAQKNYDLKVSGSYMVGDKYTDIEFGKKAGLCTVLVLTGTGRKEFLVNRKKWKYKPDYIVKDVSAAAELIIRLGEK